MCDALQCECIPGAVEEAELRRQRVQLDPPSEGEEQLEVRSECGAPAELPEKAAGGRQGVVHQQLEGSSTDSLHL